MSYNKSMTQLSLTDVQYLATLSQLQLSDQEAEHLTLDLARILEYIEQLSELDTEGVEPTYEVTDLDNVWREDVIQASPVSREDLLALAPEQKDNQIKVPKVL